MAHDRRGHGWRSQASAGNDMDGYADYLAAVLETLVRSLPPATSTSVALTLL